MEFQIQQILEMKQNVKHILFFTSCSIIKDFWLQHNETVLQTKCPVCMTSINKILPLFFANLDGCSRIIPVNIRILHAMIILLISLNLINKIISQTMP